MVEKLIATGMKRETAEKIVAAVLNKSYPTGLNLTIKQYIIIGWF